MNKTFGIILAVVATFSAGSAFAGDVYVTGAVTGTDLGVSDGNTSGFDRTIGANIGIGMNINEWLAVEGTYDYLGSNDFTYQGQYDNFSNNNAVSSNYDARAFTGWVVVDPTVVTIASMPLKVIGRVGYANTKINYDGGSVSDNQLAYGAGVGLGVTKNIDVVLDYRVYEINNNANVDLNTIGLGAKYTF